MNTPPPNAVDLNKPFMIGDWTVEPALGRLSRESMTRNLEPKVLELLLLLASKPGTLFSKYTIEETIWRGAVVGEDTVARTITRLRRALGDNAKAPTYVETLPRRGYRLIGPVQQKSRNPKITQGHLPFVNRPALAVALSVILVLAIAYTFSAPENSQTSRLTARADDLYMKFTHRDNEAAIELYERALAQDSDDPRALAGLASALVQRVIRWSPDSPTSASIEGALKEELHLTQPTQAVLNRATALAERSARRNPKDPDTLKSLGLAYSAQNRIAEAKNIYLQVIELDPGAWEAMINLGELFEIEGYFSKSIMQYENAFSVIDVVYESEPQRIGPWQAALGVAIGKKYESKGSLQDAELWYRRTLDIAPFEPEATRRLADILRRTGDKDGAIMLCTNIARKFGNDPSCPVN